MKKQKKLPIPPKHVYFSPKRLNRIKKGLIEQDEKYKDVEKEKYQGLINNPDVLDDKARKLL